MRGRCFFFFKQKTAYEMRISDWSSDVCSSDLVRMPIEVESPEEYGYGKIRYNLSESSIADQSLGTLGLTVPDLPLFYGEHRGGERLRELVLESTPGLGIDDVLITGGAAGALFIKNGRAHV